MPRLRPAPEGLFLLVVAALGVAVTVMSVRYGLGRADRPGPGFYPAGLGALMTLFAGALLPRSLHAQPADDYSKWALALMALTFGAWVAVLPIAGYPAATLAATFAFCKIMKLEGWKKPALVACGTAGGTYLLFGLFLHTDLPAGPFG